jgi:hypothetical protein
LIDDIKTIQDAIQFDDNHHDLPSTARTVARMKAATPWVTYRTRFLVKARQLTTSVTFTDLLERQHSGVPGDYLVESSDGIFRIASRQIFEDIYVPLLADEPPKQDKTMPNPDPWGQSEMSSVDSIRRGHAASLSSPPSLTRKSPQPDGDGRSPVPSPRLTEKWIG